VTHAVWVNGTLLRDPDAPVLRADDRGFLLGDVIFETIRVAGGRPRFLPAHLMRLERGRRALGLPVPRLPVDDDLASLVAHAGLRDGVLRLTVSRGPAGRGLVPVAGTAPTVVASLTPLPPPLPPEGVEVFEARPWSHPASPLAGCKVGDRAGAIAQARPQAEGVVIEAGMVCCGLSSNCFLVTDDRELVTPPAAGLVRPGVARELILGWLAPALGLSVSERPIPWPEARAAAELLFSNVVRGVFWARGFRSPRTGPRLAEAFATALRSDWPDAADPRATT
jgi:branched-chain amino acid aminotransferase